MGIQSRAHGGRSAFGVETRFSQRSDQDLLPTETAFNLVACRDLESLRDDNDGGVDDADGSTLQCFDVFVVNADESLPSISISDATLDNRKILFIVYRDVSRSVQLDVMLLVVLAFAATP